MCLSRCWSASCVAGTITAATAGLAAAFARFPFAPAFLADRFAVAPADFLRVADFRFVVLDSELDAVCVFFVAMGARYADRDGGRKFLAWEREAECPRVPTPTRCRRPFFAVWYTSA